MPAYVGGEHADGRAQVDRLQARQPGAAGVERASALIVLNDPTPTIRWRSWRAPSSAPPAPPPSRAVAARHLAQPGFRSLTCVGCGPIGRTAGPHAAGAVPVGGDGLALRPEGARGRRTGVGAGRRPPQGRGPHRRRRRVGRAGRRRRRHRHRRRRPWLPAAWLRPGSFLSNVSIMDAAKDVFLSADKVVVDDWDQCNREGKLIHQLTTEGSFSRETAPRRARRRS